METILGSSLAVQWLGLDTFTAMAQRSIPGASHPAQSNKKKKRKGKKKKGKQPKCPFTDKWTNCGKYIQGNIIQS